MLAIDFDLEAPGLERYFFESGQARALREHLGLIDLLDTYKKAMTSEAEFAQARVQALVGFRRRSGAQHPRRRQGRHPDRRLPRARREAAGLRARGAHLRLAGFFRQLEREKFFDWWRKQLVGAPEGAEHPGYDVVLVDSRTGVTEMGGVSAYQLADCAVMLCAANHQNIEGTAAVARDFRSDSVLALRRGRPLELLVIPARLEANNPKREEFLERFAEVFLPAEYFPKSLSDAGLDYRALALPYEPELAVIERLVGDAESAESATGRQAVASFERLADALTLLAAGPAGRLAATAKAARARLTGQAPAEEPAAEPVADPTSRSAGFDVYLDAARADQGLAARLAAELQERKMRVLYAEEPNLLALGLCETLVLCFGDSGSSEAANRLVASVRERKAGAPAIVPLLLAAESDPCPSGRAAARALELESQLVYLDPEREGWVDRLVAALRRARPTTEVKAPNLERDPYPGERAFGEDDAALFFGRDEELAVLVERTENNRITWLIGAAGVGKSSLAGAGLLPRWRQLLAGRSAEIVLIDCASEDGEARLAALAAPEEQTPDRRIVLDHVDSFPRGGGPAARQGRLAAIAGVAAAAARGAEDRLVADLPRRLRPRRAHPALRRGAAGRHLLARSAAAGNAPAGDRKAGRPRRPPFRARPGAAAGGKRRPRRRRRRPGAAPPAAAVAGKERGWLTTTAYNQAGGVGAPSNAASRSSARRCRTPNARRSTPWCAPSSTTTATCTCCSDVADWRELATIPDLAAVDAVALRDGLADRHLIELHRGSPSTSEKERARVGLVFRDAGELRQGARAGARAGLRALAPPLRRPAPGLAAEPEIARFPAQGSGPGRSGGPSPEKPEPAERRRTRADRRVCGLRAPGGIQRRARTAKPSGRTPKPWSP